MSEINPAGGDNLSPAESRGVTLRALGLRVFWRMCIWVCAAQCHTSGVQILWNTHPGLVEAVGVPVVVHIVLVPGMLELVPQPHYPVVITGSHLAAVRGGKEDVR